MDPVTIGLIGSTALSAFGQIIEANAQQSALADEASFYAQQAAFARFVADRDARLVAKKGADIRAQQKLTSATNGIDLSGSSLSFIDDTLAKELEEIQAIQVQGDFNYMLAKSKQQSAISGMEAVGEALPFKLLSGGISGGTKAYAAYKDRK